MGWLCVEWVLVGVVVCVGAVWAGFELVWVVVLGVLLYVD